MPTPKPVVRVLRPGDTSKQNPFTICIVANPAMEAPWQSGIFVSDPILANQGDYDASARYIDANLFGGLPEQREAMLSHPEVALRVRVVSLFVSDLPAEHANSLVGLDSVSNLLIARRDVFRPFLQKYGLDADVAYAVSAANSHTRASAWFTSDDDERPGVSFTYDGNSYYHRYYSRVPGTVAIHSTSESLTALHEFGHALSSYSNGKIVDLYVDSRPATNCRIGRPIPAIFASYDGQDLNSDLDRDSIGYPANWQSYHCERDAPDFPAVMDNYFKSPDNVPEHCEHDKITRRFLLDRIRAKIAR